MPAQIRPTKICFRIYQKGDDYDILVLYAYHIVGR